MTAQLERASKRSTLSLAAVACLAAAAFWAYWPTLERIANRWNDDPQYSHGYLVPLFAAFLLWQRRERLRFQTLSVNALGLGLLALAAGLRLAGAHYYVEYLDQISLLPTCAGLVMLAGSWPALMWAWPAVAFLAFMVPLPHSVSLALSAPMQSFATAVSTFALQVVGQPAVAEGNVILLNDVELGIIEACSGLRMLVVFFALSTAVAMLIDKPLWERWLVAASAIPIALISNVLRITATGLWYDAYGINSKVHDYLGLVMPIVGALFLGLELWVLKTLLVGGPGREAIASAAAAVPLESSPIALYRSAQTPRREKAAQPPTPEPVVQ